MENAAEALQMAAAVLIFVLALSIAINSFGQARQTSQLILGYKDREYEYSYVEDNGTTKRIVGIESIVPSIYKAYRENYKVVFDETTYNVIGLDTGLFQKRKEGTLSEYEPVFEIDLENQTLGTDEQKELFIMAVLYGDRLNKISSINFNQIKEDFRRNSGVLLNDRGLYDIIKEGTLRFEESIGQYYQEEAGEKEDSSTPGGTTDPDDESEVPESNLTLKRVITYTLY